MSEERKIVLVKRGCQNSESPLVVIVRHSNAHVRLRPAVYIKGQTTLQRRFFEGAVPLIQEQEVRIRVIGDKNIDLAILVEVIGDGGKTVRGIQIAEAGLLRHIAERTVTVVVIQHAMFTFQSDRAAKDLQTQVFADGCRFSKRKRVDLDITSYKQV